MIKKIYNRIKILLFLNANILSVEERKLVNKPFHFKGDNGEAILLVHGWTSTAYEVRRLARFLNDSGYTTMGPMLKGHGSYFKDLKNVRMEDWLMDVKLAFEELKKEHNKVYIIGNSIGANLAVIFSADRVDVAGLVLLAMPYQIRLEKLSGFFAKFVNILLPYARKMYLPWMSFSTAMIRATSYQNYPIKSALETIIITKKSRKILGKIVQPCLIMQSSNDHVVASNSLEKIYTQINSPIKKKQYVPRSYHTFISDLENAYVFKDILNFIEEN